MRVRRRVLGFRVGECQAQRWIATRTRRSNSLAVNKLQTPVRDLCRFSLGSEQGKTVPHDGVTGDRFLGSNVAVVAHMPIRRRVLGFRVGECQAQRWIATPRRRSNSLAVNKLQTPVREL